MVSNSVVVEVSLTAIGQPECCRKLVSDGWTFRYEPETALVYAEDENGGYLRVVDLYRIDRVLIDPDQIGEAIAMLLNGIDGTKNEGQSA